MFTQPGQPHPTIYNGSKRPKLRHAIEDDRHRGSSVRISDAGCQSRISSRRNIHQKRSTPGHSNVYAPISTTSILFLEKFNAMAVVAFACGLPNCALLSSRGHTKHGNASSEDEQDQKLITSRFYWRAVEVSNLRPRSVRLFRMRRERRRGKATMITKSLSFKSTMFSTRARPLPTRTFAGKRYSQPEDYAERHPRSAS